LKALLSGSFCSEAIGAQNGFITGRNKRKLINVLAAIRTVYIHIVHLSRSARSATAETTAITTTLILPISAIAVVAENLSVSGRLKREL